MLLDDVGHERHEACALDRFSQGSLIWGRKSCASAWQNFTVGVYKFLQGLDVFVVDTLEMGYVIVFSWHAILSKSCRVNVH